MTKIPYRWVVAIVLSAAYSIQYLDRVTSSVLNPAIAKDLGLSISDIGTGTFLMLLFYGPAQYLSGLLTDRFGSKKILILSIIAWSLMTAGMGMIQTRPEYFVRMAIFGFLVGTEYVPSARILMRWFNKAGRARAQALLSWAWILTPAWASIFATQLAVHAGNWRLVFFVTAGLGLVPLFLISCFIFDRPEQYKRITRKELEYSYRDEIETGVLKGDDYSNVKNQILVTKRVVLADLFRNRSYLAVMAVVVVMQIIFWGIMVWVPLYLSDTFEFNLKHMGWWNAFYFVAGAVGSFSSSYLSDTFFRNKRRVMIMVCFIGLAPFILLLASLKGADQTLLAIALCGMGFFGNMAWGPVLSVPAEIFSPEVYGKAMGLVNCVGYMAGACSSKIFAALVVVHGDVKDYTLAWLFITACVIAGIFASSFIRTSRPETNAVGVSS